MPPQIFVGATTSLENALSAEEFIGAGRKSLPEPVVAHGERGGARMGRS